MNEIIKLSLLKSLTEKGFVVENKESKIEIYWAQDCDAQTKIPYEPTVHLNGSEYDLEFDKEEFKTLFFDKNKYCIEIYIPTISDVVMWFYKKHGIWVSVNNNGSYFLVNIFNCINYKNESYRKDNIYDDPTEAYTEGIKYCLKELI